MKIAVIAFGEQCNIPCLNKWIKNYKDSKTELQPVLIYDHTLNKSVLDLWPFEKKQSTLELNIHTDQDLYNKETCFNFYKADILKMYAYNEIGSCIVIDYDAFIMKKIDESIIPVCGWGMALHNNQSNYFHSKNISFNLTNFDEYDFVPYYNLGVQIVNQNVFSEFMFFVNKYMYKLVDSIEPACLMQQIASLTIHDCNGTILQPEWNWYPDSKVSNNKVIIEHHYGPRKNSI